MGYGWLCFFLWFDLFFCGINLSELVCLLVDLI